MDEEKKVNEETAEEPEVKTEEKAEKENQKSKKDDKKDDKKLKKENAELTEKIEKLEKENKEQADKYLRLVAEYDNFRKRSAKEKDSAYSDAYSDALINILPVIDNLERAISFGESSQVVDGVKMTLTQFSAALEKMGVKEIETKTFDPTLHNAVMHVEDEEHGENEIVEVFQKGYIKGDKVIRFAMVKVAN